MTYPTGTITHKGMTYECQVKDIHINGNRARCLVEVDNYTPFSDYYYGAGWGNSNTTWVEFGFIKFDYPMTPQELLNDIQEAEAHEYRVELQEMRMSL